MMMRLLAGFCAVGLFSAIVAFISCDDGVPEYWQEFRAAWLASMACCVGVALAAWLYSYAVGLQ